jgi:O-antigen/teichoic acid export membrane protein
VRRHLTNAGYGVVDYISFPAGMLLVAPFVLRRMGAAEYGLWMIATAAISVGGIIASGFGDACIQRAAHLRGAGEFSSVPGAIRGLLAINLTLGLVLGGCIWLAAPFAASRIAAAEVVSHSECVICLRIAAIAVVFRALESVAVGAQRAFERYRGTVQISVAMRLITLASAAGLALLGQKTISLLIATAAFLAVGAAMQFRELLRLLPADSLRLGFQPDETRLLLRQGFFVWLQAVGGVVFGQFDRILLGIALGALAVTPYALCVQFAHPLFGLTASGLNFLFPYLSSLAAGASKGLLRRSVVGAFLCNLALVAGSAGILLVFGERLIRFWAGPAVAQNAAGLLPPIVMGSALMGLSVTGTYALQALGEFRVVAVITLAGRAAALLLMIEMLRQFGLYGLALSRLLSGSISLLVYLPLLQRLRAGQPSRSRASTLAIPIEADEVSEA